MDETIKIVRVYSVKQTNHDDLEIDVEVIDYEMVESGVQSRIPFRYREGDPYSRLTPVITQWIADNNPEILPYIPPPELTPEELRAMMPELTPREFRDALIDVDIMPDHVTAAIGLIPNAKQKAKALNAWEYPTQFTRTDPLIDQIGNMFNFTAQQIDEMWRVASGRGR